MVRSWLAPFASFGLLLGLSSGCGAGPTNSGGAPNVNNSNLTNVPGGPINMGGAPDVSKSSPSDVGKGAPDPSKTNATGLPGGPINGGGTPDLAKTNLGVGPRDGG